MIKEIKKIVTQEIKKDKKRNLYKKKIATDASKIVSITIGKLSY